MGQPLNPAKFTEALVIGPQCAYCRHRASGDFNVCPAFPGSIPSAILSNQFDHRQAHPDEAVPVRFEPREDVPAEVLANLFSP